MTVKLDEYYKVIDRIPKDDRERLGLSDKINFFRDLGESSLVVGSKRTRCYAIWTGEKRCPKAGEWYLSGAVCEAYRAAEDMNSEYYIARLVKVEEEGVLVRTVLS